MRTNNFITILLAIIITMFAIGCSNNSQKPDTFKINAEIPVELCLTENQNGSIIAVQPSLMKDTVHISELVRYPGDNEITAPFYFKDIEKYAQITEANLDKRIAICINGEIVSTPVIKMKISNGACSVLLSKKQIANYFPNIHVEGI